MTLPPASACFVALLAAGLSLSSLAAARQEYNDAVTQAAGTPCDAQLCIACHQTAAGGGAVSQPFYATIIEAGYFFPDPETAAAALRQLSADATDTDDDGVPDAEELLVATNPNAVGGANACSGAEFGCVSLAPRGPGNPLPEAAAMVLALLARRRKLARWGVLLRVRGGLRRSEAAVAWLRSAS